MRLPAILRRPGAGAQPAQVLERETVADMEAGIWPQVSEFWSATFGGVGFSPRLIKRLWVANRCLQLNSQQIAAMPLRFIGNNQPAWVTNPDPVWYPNGIGDAVFSAVWSMYGWGDAFLYVTSRYANGLPSGWTVLDPAAMDVQLVNGARVFRSGGYPLSGDDIVQISRNPSGGLRGQSALSAYADHLWAAVAGGVYGREASTSPVPNAIIKSQRKLTEEQAQSILEQWVAAATSRGAHPAVLPPELDFEQLAFSPKDLMLLEAQEFNARVIASAFNVPAFMLNIPLAGGLTYQNPEILFDFWWRAELRPAAKRVSDALSSQMLPRGSSVTFDAREVLAPNLQGMHTIWLEAFKEGAVTADEYRRAVLQLGPMGETAAIDELLQPASAGASPADQPTQDVVTLRPVQVNSL